MKWNVFRVHLLLLHEIKNEFYTTIFLLILCSKGEIDMQNSFINKGMLGCCLELHCTHCTADNNKAAEPDSKILWTDIRETAVSYSYDVLRPVLNLAQIWCPLPQWHICYFAGRQSKNGIAVTSEQHSRLWFVIYLDLSFVCLLSCRIIISVDLGSNFLRLYLNVAHFLYMKVDLEHRDEFRREVGGRQKVIFTLWFTTQPSGSVTLVSLPS